MNEKSNQNSLLSEESFFNELQSHVQKHFKEFFLNTNTNLKQSILKASDQYIFDQNISLWDKVWFQEAYMSYFIFTQSSRIARVFKQSGEHLKSLNIENIIDVGCGPGTAQYVFEVLFPNLCIKKWINIDSSPIALKYAKKHLNNTKLSNSFIKSSSIPKPSHPNDLLFLSYSLCEGLDLEPLLAYNNILIIEPGQIQTSRNLIKLREKALKTDFQVLAPCTHQEQCPMSTTKKHWCHDHAPKPSFLNDYKLPFSETKLSLSYLFLSKSQKRTDLDLARITGDLRTEKGKFKVAICQNKSFEFLSWLKKTNLNLDLSRGDLIRKPKDYEKKGNEIRIHNKIKTL